MTDHAKGSRHLDALLEEAVAARVGMRAERCTLLAAADGDRRWREYSDAQRRVKVADACLLAALDGAALLRFTAEVARVAERSVAR